MDSLDNRIHDMIENLHYAESDAYGLVKDFRRIISDLIKEEIEKAANPNYGK